MKEVIERLQVKRTNLQRSLQQADLRVLVAERELQETREARAACSAALRVVDETIAEITSPPAKPPLSPPAV